MMMLSNLAEAARQFQTATRMRQHCELLRIPHTISPSFPESDIEVEMLRAGIRSASRILANRGTKRSGLTTADNFAGPDLGLDVIPSRLLQHPPFSIGKPRRAKGKKGKHAALQPIVGERAIDPKRFCDEAWRWLELALPRVVSVNIPSLRVERPLNKGA
jgi:hypothetical protein